MDESTLREELQISDLKDKFKKALDCALAEDWKANTTEEGAVYSRLAQMWGNTSASEAGSDEQSELEADDSDNVKARTTVTAREFHANFDSSKLDLIAAWTAKFASTMRTVKAIAREWTKDHPDTVKDRFEEYMQNQIALVDKGLEYMNAQLNIAAVGEPSWTFDHDKVDLSTAVLFGDGE